MSREQQMQIRKMHEQQDIKLVAKQFCTEARIAALEAQLMIDSQPGEGEIKKKGGETPKELAWGRNRGNPTVTHQALGGKCKEPS